MFLVMARELHEVESIDDGVVKMWHITTDGQVQSSTVEWPGDDELERIAKMYEESLKPLRK